jgi:Flp pilus assembly protein TadB
VFSRRRAEAPHDGDREGGRRFFRFVAAVALMAALLLLYVAHPVAGWATIVALFVLRVVFAWNRTRRAHPA